MTQALMHDAPAPIEPPAEPPAEPRFDWRSAAFAAATYVALRLICIAVLWHFAAEQHKSLWKVLGRNDAAWYAALAVRGYDTAIPLKPDGTPATTNLAFFPFYPALIRLLDPVLPGGSDVAGILIAWLAGAVAATGLYALGSLVRDRPTGILLAALWAVIPHAHVESMGYTDTLFAALASWSLYFLLRRSWVLAGLLCLVAGLTRATAAALIAAVGLSALIAVVQRRDGWRPWAGGVLAPLGLAGFMAWVGYRLHRADGYFYVQHDAWKFGLDDGRYTIRTAKDLLLQPGPLALHVVSLTLLAATVLLVVLAVYRVPWQLPVYAAVIVALEYLGDGYYNAKARHLIPAFVLLIPVAAGLAKARRPVAVATLAGLTLVSAGYGVYLGLVWAYSP